MFYIQIKLKTQNSIILANNNKYLNKKKEIKQKKQSLIIYLEKTKHNERSNQHQGRIKWHH